MVKREIWMVQSGMEVTGIHSEHSHSCFLLSSNKRRYAMKYTFKIKISIIYFSDSWSLLTLCFYLLPQVNKEKVEVLLLHYRDWSVWGLFLSEAMQTANFFLLEQHKQVITKELYHYLPENKAKGNRSWESCYSNKFAGFLTWSHPYLNRTWRCILLYGI